MKQTPAVAVAATVACLKRAEAKRNLSLRGQKKKGTCNVMEDSVALETEMVRASKLQRCKYFEFQSIFNFQFLSQHQSHT